MIDLKPVVLIQDRVSWIIEIDLFGLRYSNLRRTFMKTRLAVIFKHKKRCKVIKLEPKGPQASLIGYKEAADV